jgi:thioredoxin reductase
MAKIYDVVVIGGGQSGLAWGYFLRRNIKLHAIRNPRDSFDPIKSYRIFAVLFL